MNDVDFDRFLGVLSSASEQCVLYPGRLDWPDAVDADGWYFTPELISLYGTPLWESLSDRQQKRLGLCEAVNFFSINVHGEQYLISEISRHLRRDGNDELSRYLQHFVAEESRHMTCFSEFCTRYAGRIYADRSVHPGGSDDAELDRFLLFARINVFEEIVDHYNGTMAKDPRLVPIAREINRLHHLEELRHLAFGRRFLARCVDRHTEGWGTARLAELRRHLSGYLQYAWKQYSSPVTYAEAGIDDPFAAWREASASAAVKQHRASVNQKRLGFLRKLALLEDA